MFDQIPPDLNPNVTSSITYDQNAPFADPIRPDTLEYPDVPDEMLVPLVVSLSSLCGIGWITEILVACSSACVE
jgi:hypothetical protein